MAEPSYTSGGYPVSPLERFVTGFESGYNSMLDIKKKSQELKTSLAYEEAANAKPKKAIGDGESSTTREGAYDTGGTTGSGGGSEGGGGGSSSGGGGGGKWGEYAAPIMDYFKKAGYSEAAIQGIMANGLAEGGFANNWVPGDKGTSFGHWQFHEGGELGPYKQWAAKNGITDLQNSLNQAKFVDYRMNQINPNFKNIGDAREATNQFHIGFEKPKDQTPGLRFGHLATAQRYMSGGGAPAGPTTASAAPAAAPAIGSGSSTPLPPRVTLDVNGNPQLPVGDATQADLDRAYDYAEGRAAAPAASAPAAAPAPAAAIAPTPAPAPTMATGLRPPSGALPAFQPPSQPQPQQGAPGQQSAIGSNRPQAPPPPSVLAQLVQENPYLPQQIAALRQVRQGAPQSALYSGFA